MSLKLYTATDHAIINPVGGASIVLAHSREEAIVLLDEALECEGLEGFAASPYTLIEQPLTHAYAVVLRNGDY